jgi:hypothetical protein
MRAALAVRAAKPARPFVVEVKRVQHLLILAESEGDAFEAVRQLDREDLEVLLSRTELEIGDPEDRDADDACYLAGIAFDPKGYHDESERYFWAVGGHLFRPDTAPAQLYVAVKNRDHSLSCKAWQRPSGRAFSDAGPCNCNARVFPGPPAAVEVP